MKLLIQILRSLVELSAGQIRYEWNYGRLCIYELLYDVTTYISNKLHNGIIKNTPKLNVAWDKLEEATEKWQRI